MSNYNGHTPVYRHLDTQSAASGAKAVIQAKTRLGLIDDTVGNNTY